jgi:hypothetical protein
MGTRKNYSIIDLAGVFHRVQDEMIASFSVDRLFHHSGTHGAALEQDWLKLFQMYLPKRYSAAPAFVINSAGSCSRQIDVAIFDNLASAPLFPHPGGVYVPIESVYAVFEVKASLNTTAAMNAGAKAASVRALMQEPRPILAGVLATDAKPRGFEGSVQERIQYLPPGHELDLGCILTVAAFENTAEKMAVSQPEEALIFFLLRLIDRLDNLGPAPRVDLMQYARGVVSFQR